MVMITRRRFNSIASASLFIPSIIPSPAWAQPWPTRAVRLIVPFAAGGPTDVIARILAERLARTWGQQVLIENRPGGGTNIANEVVLHSEADGHTVLMGGQSQATTRALYRSLGYDPVGDFAPVAFICGYSFFMFVPNSLPVKSVSEGLSGSHLKTSACFPRVRLWRSLRLVPTYHVRAWVPGIGNRLNWC
jgi:tripartite-type tricarboxylate transporter receptor subunit TctC